MDLEMENNNNNSCDFTMGGEHQLNSFLQKLGSQMNSSDSLAAAAASLLFPASNETLTPPPQIGAGNTSFSDQMASISAMARESPAFAQYLAVAMAALSGNGTSGGPSGGAVVGGPVIGQPQLPTPSTLAAPLSPQVDVVVKQGNSRCVECNIVFYKHENYLVHKELYCASRRTSASMAAAGNSVNSPLSPLPVHHQQNNGPLSITRPTSAHSSSTASSISPSSANVAAVSPSLMLLSPGGQMTKSLGTAKAFASGVIRSPMRNHSQQLDEQSRLSPVGPLLNTVSSSSSPSSVASASPSLSSPKLPVSTTPSSAASAAAIFQYYCAACGIKFTSYDNLQAHQTYYCLKRSSSVAATSAAAAVAAQQLAVSPVPLSPSPNGSVAPSTGSAATPAAFTPQQLLAAAAALQQSANLGDASTSSNTSSTDLQFASLAEHFTNSPSFSQHLALISAVMAGSKQMAVASASGGKLGVDYYCVKCKATYVSAETLAAHICSADRHAVVEKPLEVHVGNAKSTGTNSTPSTASLQTYKCTICGYKGHTMRGMRTHVRVHSEQLAATGAYEEEFIIQNTDLPEPSLGRGRGAHHHLANNNNQNHGNSANNAMGRGRRRSSAATAVATDANDHLEQPLVHQNRKKSTLMSAIDQDQQQQMLQQAAVAAAVKAAAAVAPNGDHSQSSGHLSPESASGGSLVAQNHTCQFCRYTSNYKVSFLFSIFFRTCTNLFFLVQGNVIRHIKLVHKDISSAQSLAASIALQQQQQQQAAAVAAFAKELQGAMSFANGACSETSGDLDDHSKAEDAKQRSSPLSRTLSPANMMSNGGGSCKSEAIDGNGDDDEQSQQSLQQQELDTRHCNSCNISFTYRNSYIAHKKYYCNSQSTTEA